MTDHCRRLLADLAALDTDQRLGVALAAAVGDQAPPDRLPELLRYRELLLGELLAAACLADLPRSQLHALGQQWELLAAARRRALTPEQARAYALAWMDNRELLGRLAVAPGGEVDSEAWSPEDKPSC